MAGEAPERSQYDRKANELFADDGDEFFYSYDELCDIFDSMRLQENLLRGIYSYGFERPSAIQQSQSGTGKTDTVCSGILQQLPTRVLVLQIEEVMNALGKYLDVKGFSIHVDKEERIPRRFKYDFKCELSSKRSLLPTRCRKSGSREGIKQPRKALQRKR